MGCFPCLSGPSPVGEEDAYKPDSFIITIQLSTGLQLPVYALPTDTVSNIRRKVQREYGVQPNVCVMGQMIPPPILARHQGKWFPVRPDATISDLDLETPLRFADITDQLNQVKVFSHLHWAASNALVWASD